MKHRWTAESVSRTLPLGPYGARFSQPVVIIRCRRCGLSRLALPHQSRHRWRGHTPPSCRRSVAAAVLAS